MEAGRHVLTREDVMEGIAELVPEVQVEATFPDGEKEEARMLGAPVVFVEVIGVAGGW